MYVCIGGGDRERGIVWQRKYKTYFLLSRLYTLWRAIPWSSNFSMLQNHLGSLLKHILLGHTLRVSDSVDWGRGLRVCISNISQVILMLLVWDHILRNIALKLLPSYSFLCISFVIWMLKSSYHAEKLSCFALYWHYLHSVLT